MTSAAGRLRTVLAGPGPAVAPGCWDAVTARLVERAGYPVAYISGATVAAVRLGVPDLGLAGLTDILDVARVVVPATTLPVVADADAGFGERIHVAHTVERYASAGLAGLHLEDQVLPKRCGHMSGVRLTDPRVAADHIAAAVGVGADILVIARTDALGVEGRAAALERAVRYADAGADAIFVEGVRTPDDVAEVAAAVARPVVVSLSEAGGKPAMTASEAASAGAALVILPVRGLLAALGAYAAAIAATSPPGPGGTLGWNGDTIGQFDWTTLTDALGLPALTALAEQSTAERPTAGSAG